MSLDPQFFNDTVNACAWILMQSGYLYAHDENKYLLRTNILNNRSAFSLSSFFGVWFKAFSGWLPVPGTAKLLRQLLESLLLFFQQGLEISDDF